MADEARLGIQRSSRTYFPGVGCTIFTWLEEVRGAGIFPSDRPCRMGTTPPCATIPTTFNALHILTMLTRFMVYVVMQAVMATVTREYKPQESVLLRGYEG